MQESRDFCDLQFHQPMRRKADHLAQQIGIGALFQKPAKAHHLIGHRGHLRSGYGFGDQTLSEIRDDPRYG
ncbi:MAG: hypothetical protein IH626_01410 [Rhodospirillales bacterium]|nr:hypothetical protein [Rhodospirillales bacterium]